MRSLKTTPLTWGLQLQIGIEERSAQGHHRLRNSSGCVEKCRRDDILPALRCQRLIVRGVRDGWVPCTALARGLTAVQEWDPSGLLVLSESETEREGEDAESAEPGEIPCGDLELSDGDDSVCSDVGSDASDIEEVAASQFIGPWILNMATGWYDRGVQCKPSEASGVAFQDERLCLACRPTAVLGAHYEVRFSHPGMAGVCECRHRAHHDGPDAWSTILTGYYKALGLMLMSLDGDCCALERVLVPALWVQGLGPGMVSRCVPACSV